GSIIVFHDSEKAAENMLYMLPEFLAHFSEKGYAFNVIDGHRT
ncbi:MAG: polysaccharide deacetylase family protein, partial [Bacteroidetes bacterium]